VWRCRAGGARPTPPRAPRATLQQPALGVVVCGYRGTSLIRNSAPLGPRARPTPQRGLRRELRSPALWCGVPPYIHIYMYIYTYICIIYLYIYIFYSIIYIYMCVCVYWVNVCFVVWCWGRLVFGAAEQEEPESGPLRVVHLSRHKWPGGLVN